MFLNFHITTGSRLHFGLCAFGPGHERQFGGVGMMVEEPKLDVRFEPADQFIVKGAYSERVTKFVESAAGYWGLMEVPRLSICVKAAPQEHSGLGVGTQLGCAIATGLARILKRPELSAQDLAAAVGRGERSAVGTYGFLQGGLLLDGGKREHDSIGRLEQRVDFPNEWRILMIRASDHAGLSGFGERSAFAEISPVPLEISNRLRQLAVNEIFPAAATNDCERFGAAVYEYGRVAGECFAAVQGGSYADSKIAEAVAVLRELGVSGVGQSSWGPTVFGVVPNQETATSVAGQLIDGFGFAPERIVITQGRNCGAVTSF